MPGVYISYPFCNQKCTFCNFASNVAGAVTPARYEHALLGEVRSHDWQWRPETIYLGGGTPSLMDPDLVRQLMDAIPREHVREATLECEPGTLDATRVLTWCDAGINRVSLGIQSFHDKELRQTGRRHSAQTVVDDVNLLRRYGVDNVNIDLIAGLPHQTWQSWNQSLDAVADLAPPHVSVYLLEVDDDSRLGSEIIAGGARYGAALLPSEDDTASFYEHAVARLSAMGLRRYEISNFARPGAESLHNLKYWKREPYVGFGLDAHSFDGEARWRNPDNLLGYLDVLRDSKRPEREAVDPAEERFYVGLRLLEGVAPTADERVRFAAPIERWTRAGLLLSDGDRLRLAPEAVLVSNEIFQDFLLAHS